MPIDRSNVQRAKAQAMMPGLATRPIPGVRPAMPVRARAPMPMQPMPTGPRVAPAAPMLPPQARPPMPMPQGGPMLKKGGRYAKGGRVKEGSAADKKADRVGAKKAKMSLKDYEASPADERADAGEYKRGGKPKAPRSKVARYAMGGAGKTRKGQKG